MKAITPDIDRKMFVAYRLLRNRMGIFIYLQLLIKLIVEAHAIRSLVALFTPSSGKEIYKECHASAFAQISQ